MPETAVIQPRVSLTSNPKLLKDRYLNIKKGICPLGWAMAGSINLFDTSFASDRIVLGGSLGASN